VAVARSLFPPAVVVCGLCAALTHPAAATVAQPDDPVAVPVAGNGTPEPFPFQEFRRRLVDLRNEAIPDFNTKERERVLGRIKAREGNRARPADESAALAADLLRVGKFDPAVNLLKPLYDDRDRKGTRTYLVVATLVHAHALRNEWDQALGYYLDLLDLDPPAAVPKLTAAQWKWQLTLDRGPLKEYLRAHRQIALRAADAAKRAELDAAEEPFALFPGARFTTESGQYEPQKATLPADAVAVVQQLLFWFPEDTRLYWLLGEVYAARGQFAEARVVFDECAGGRAFGNRRALMAHREAVGAWAAKADAEAKAKADEEERQRVEAAKAAEPPISLRTVLLYFGVVGVVAAFAAVRVLARRVRGGHCGPVG
jgi:hypothetical protein